MCYILLIVAKITFLCLVKKLKSVLFFDSLENHPGHFYLHAVSRYQFTEIFSTDVARLKTNSNSWHCLILSNDHIVNKNRKSFRTKEKIWHVNLGTLVLHTNVYVDDTILRKKRTCLDEINHFKTNNIFCSRCFELYSSATCKIRVFQNVHTF